MSNFFGKEWSEIMTRDPYPEFCKICMGRTIPIRDPYLKSRTKGGSWEKAWTCRVCGTENFSSEIREEFDIVSGVELVPKKKIKEPLEGIAQIPSYEELHSRREKTARAKGGM
jgi:hypothetical protein